MGAPILVPIVVIYGLYGYVRDLRDNRPSTDSGVMGDKPHISQIKMRVFIRTSIPL